MVIIVGAGITGLALAEYLSWAEIPFKLLEASDRIGGNIQTSEIEGFQLESGPNSLRLDGDLFGLIERLGLVDRMVFADKAAKKRYVLRNGAYHALPKGPLSLLFSSFFSWKTKEMLWNERSLPSSWVERETVDAFVRRRFGDELADYGAGPFVAGIYAGNAKNLLVEEAFPRLKGYEMEQGSVIKGAMRAAKGNKHKGIISFPGGLQEMVDALGERLSGHIELNSPVVSIDRDDRLSVKTAKGTFECAAVVFTTPAHASARILQDFEPEVARSLKKVDYPPVAVVQTAYNKSQINHPLDGFGALHNVLEPSETLGTIFSSTIFPNRVPKGKALLTTFVGGSLQPEKAQLEPEDLRKAVLQDHKRFLGVSGSPLFQQIVKWPKAIPQYDSNILSSRAYLRKMEIQKIYFGGNWIGGVSVSNCVQRAKDIAEKISGRRPSN